jgi:hypothetical protein
VAIILSLVVDEERRIDQWTDVLLGLWSNSLLWREAHTWLPHQPLIHGFLALIICEAAVLLGEPVQGNGDFTRESTLASAKRTIVVQVSSRGDNED